jgi:hypothetical protein
VVRLTGFTQEPAALDLDRDDAIEEDESAWRKSAGSLPLQSLRMGVPNTPSTVLSSLTSSFGIVAGRQGRYPRRRTAILSCPARRDSGWRETGVRKYNRKEENLKK